MTRSIKSLQDMRSIFAQFCADRDWQQFHLPTNLLLALSGECGEVSEIYQWKGSLESNNWKEFLPTKFSEKEVIHIGEELADVCIYSVRLADVCNIDLAHALRKALGIRCEKAQSFEKDPEQAKAEWEDISFEHMANLAEVYVNSREEGSPRSQRHAILSLHHSLGVVCQLFGSRSEVDNQVGLPHWSAADLQSFADALALINVALTRLAAFSSLSLSQCILDKLTKNEAKYPVSLAKGSSAKYTTYSDKLQLKKPQETEGSKSTSTSSGSSIGGETKTVATAAGEKSQHDAKKMKDLMRRMEDIENKLPVMVILLVLAALALGYAVGRYY